MTCTCGRCMGTEEVPILREEELPTQVEYEYRCEGCGEEHPAGIEVLEFEGEYFCDGTCLAQYVGAEWKVLGET